MDENGVARGHLGAALDHLVGGQVVENDTDRLPGLQPVRHPDYVLRRDGNETRVPTHDRHGRDAIPPLQIPHLRAD